MSRPGCGRSPPGQAAQADPSPDAAERVWRGLPGGPPGAQVPVRFPRRPPQAAPLRPEAQDRRRRLGHAARTGVRAASRAFRVPVSTIARGRRRFRPDDLTTLEPARAADRTRRATWTAARARPAWPRARTAPAWARGRSRFCWPAGASRWAPRWSAGCGAACAALPRGAPPRAPPTVRARRERPQRPYATRVPKDTRPPAEPGALAQRDPVRPPTDVAVGGRHRRRWPLRPGRGPGDGLGGDRDGLARRAPRPDAGPRPGDPGRRRQCVHGGGWNGLPGAGHRPLRVATALPQAQRSGRAPQRDRPARAPGVRRGRPRLARTPRRLARLGAPGHACPTPPSARVPPPAAALSSQSFSHVPI